MPERQIDSFPNLTPEYWDGHHAKDDCIIEETPLEDFIKLVTPPPLVKEQLLEMQDRLKDQLERYELLQEGVQMPLARFEKGSVFVPDSYLHGTLIRVTSEVLNLNFMEKGIDAYDTGETFGFIADTDGLTEDGKNAILYFSKNYFYGGSSENIIIGATQHTRILVYSFRPDYVSRIKNIDIISLGGGSLKKVEGPSPQFIYPSPLPKPA